MRGGVWNSRVVMGHPAVEENQIRGSRTDQKFPHKSNFRSA
jgi:hypothetical protein